MLNAGLCLAHSSESVAHRTGLVGLVRQMMGVDSLAQAETKCCQRAASAGRFRESIDINLCWLCSSMHGRNLKSSPDDARI